MEGLAERLTGRLREIKQREDETTPEKLSRKRSIDSVQLKNKFYNTKTTCYKYKFTYLKGGLLIHFLLLLTVPK